MRHVHTTIASTCLRSRRRPRRASDRHCLNITEIPNSSTVPANANRQRNICTVCVCFIGRPVVSEESRRWLMTGRARANQSNMPTASKRATTHGRHQNTWTLQNNRYKTIARCATCVRKPAAVCMGSLRCDFATRACPSHNCAENNNGNDYHMAIMIDAYRSHISTLHCYGVGASRWSRS